MELDDEQLLRHSARQQARFLKIFYDEMVYAGLPKKLAQTVTMAQWQQLQANNQTESMVEAMMEAYQRFAEMQTLESEDDE